MIAGVVVLIVVLALTEKPSEYLKCKDCQHFGSYGITPRAYNHYQEDIFYEEPRQDFKNRFDGVVGICKHPEFGGKIIISEDYCYRKNNIKHHPSGWCHQKSKKEMTKWQE